MRTLWLLIASTALAAASSLHAANHKVRVIDSKFVPAALTIDVGDTVTWTNEGSMAHNVHADDDRFRCAEQCRGLGGGGGGGSDYDPENPDFASGDPASGSWSVSLTFNNQEVIGYHCDVHGAANGVGMSGKVTVGGAAGGSGSLRFAANKFDVKEQDSTGVVRVERTGGDSGAVGVTMATSSGSATAGVDFENVLQVVTWADGESGQRQVQVPLIDDALPESTEIVNLELSLPSGGATLGVPSAASLRIADNDGGGGGGKNAGVLSFEIESIVALESSGTVSLRVLRSEGSDGIVAASFEAQARSALVGQDFDGTLGQVEFADGDSDPKTITIPLVTDASAEGVEMFDVVLAGASIGFPNVAHVLIVDGASAPCVTSQTNLCLAQDRFSVQTYWQTDKGAEGSGTPVKLSGDTGYFWFFGAANIELVAKLLNACGFAGNFWFFGGGLTSVRAYVVVVDVQTGNIRLYENPLNTAFAPIQDTHAFGCP